MVSQLFFYAEKFIYPSLITANNKGDYKNKTDHRFAYQHQKIGMLFCVTKEIATKLQTPKTVKT